MKYSIKRQFAGIFGLLMVGTILFCWFINNTFLERYYMKDKQKALLETYQVLNRASNEDKIGTDEFDIEFQKICGRYNVSFILLDAKSKTLKTSTPDYSTLSRRLLNNLFEQNYEDNDRLLQKGEKYEIQIATDDRINTDFLEMWGVLDNGNLFLLRCPLESIRESVNLANRFLAYVGFGAAIVSAVIVLIISGKITKPIKELTEISERMIHLDFEAKYTGKSKTEIALLGQNINELSCTLEQTISELKSANNELQRDIEKKNKIDEMRKEFLSNVSHELKTPIALIQGYAEGLKEGISDDEESRDFYCEVIMDEASKMNNMVKKLLTLNQLEFGNDNVTMERFDIVSLIKNYLQSAEILCRQKDVKVIMKEYQPIYVWADEFMVEEVFGNYFSNAMNHVADDKVIDVKLLVKEKTVRISVFNTGEPIPEESISHIWEKFYKVDKARTREYGGSGVGLSIVKAIMDALNREYGVENYNNGVEFWFELETVGESNE
ncbi:MAG: HAMP domain-containing histidine kinase [Lachnospiraceae bacterium]|nr:HAMP domain-containing histidine kinase [Lachnospiraceae bacterium]MDD7627548.1 HAMP domain-containing sensor histidine kinase [Lachnospiraceae bacterium]MDY4120219.1 HAMP domain-containing sensor histidine kinase [Lachnospiraceae bacterium]